MAGRSRTIVYLMLVLVMLLWSGNSVVARAIHEEMPPFTLAFWRWSGATLIALPVAWRYLRQDWPVAKANWKIILFLGVIGVGCFNAFMYSGLQYTTAANSLLIQAAIPALVLLFDFLFFRNRPRAVQVAGVIMAAAGVLTIILQGNPSALFAMVFNRGDLLVLCAVTLWSLYTVFLRLRPKIHGLSFLAITAFIGVLCMAPLSAYELTHARVIMTPGVAAGVAYVILLPSLVAYFLFNLAVEQIGAGDAGQVINLQPVFGALLAALLLDEPLHGYHLAGMGLIFIGIALPFLRRSVRAPMAH
ncbi:drug/metabolite transporter (DMT)-like permease [Sphingobium sp. B1D7B]|uniref:DMT family transporter n=1 Tax=unclassified Sphingobium TaxID=2611147 RepID=UPI002224F73A|nr:MULTISPECIES: DMT family transporter [unclassified Sphingobium]MCW2391465.1 drug/metabolite transporter (DMT)-like permease [Sphingobium sp. B11D3A]MCW2406677.1 drug/metabolite transporter (DMT)-like permease [Sphingobium sp. B1D7B]